MTQRVCAASAAAGNAAAQWQQTTATGASIAKLRERLPTRRAHWTSVITVLSVMSHMYCCAKWCSTSGKSGEHLFRLPSDHRFSIWLKYANRLELLETPREKVYKTYRLCSKHFTRDCFTSDACTRLTHEAVPSVKVHEPRLRALVHPDFYEGGAAQGIESASPLQSTAAPVEVMLGHDYLPLPSTLGLGTIAGADSAVHDTDDPHSSRAPQLTDVQTTPPPPADEEGAAQSTPIRVIASASWDSPDYAEAGPSGLSGAKESVRQPVMTPASGTPKSRRRKGAVVYTPRTKKRFEKLHSRSDRYRKALSRIRKRHDTRRVTQQEALNKLEPHLPQDLFELVKAQIRLCSFPKSKKHWSKQIKQFALNLFFHSPKAYRFLREKLHLPHVRTLRRWLADIPMTPGIIPGAMDAIESITKDWPLQDKACCLLFDEISLKKNLMYDQSKDIVIGFTDDGNTRTSRVANIALVMAVSGISRSWMQPVAFAASHNATSVLAMRKLLLDLIQQLQTKGLLVKAVICDQGSNNVSLSRMLIHSIHEPYFVVNNRKIYFMFDTPHLIKCTKNNLRRHKLTIGSEVVDWTHIETLYKKTRHIDRASKTPVEHLKSRLAKKLKEQHIYRMPFADMRVKYATQVFSESVSVALLTLIAIQELPVDAKFTAEFTERMDKLFDCLNSSALKKQDDKLRYAMTEGSEHHVFLESCIDWIAQWHFGGPLDKQPHTIKGWQITIKALLLLWTDLKADFDYTHLFTRRLQQDPLENFFAIVRQKHGCNETPNVYQFVAAVKHIWIGQLFKLSQGNCEVTTHAFLTNLESVSAVLSPSSTPSTSHSRQQGSGSSDLQASSQDAPDIVYENVVYHVAGTLVKSFLDQRTTECTCEGTLLAADGGSLHGRHQFFALLKENGVPEHLFQSIAATSEACLNYIKKLDSAFRKEISCCAHLSNVSRNLVERMPNQQAVFCSLGCKIKFLKLFCRTRLHWHLSFLNRSMTSKTKQSAPARKRRKLAS
ncbi:uncharacterized protein LOC144105484 isoform X1 [Amblyomma americanum]